MNYDTLPCLKATSFFYIRKSVLTSALLSKECVFHVLQAQSPESPKLEVA